MSNCVLDFFKNKGFKVKIRHIKKSGLLQCNGLPVQAITTVDLLSPDGTLEAYGKSHCSVHDQFSRKEGRTIALRRALSVMAPILRDNFSQKDINEMFWVIDENQNK